MRNSDANTIVPIGTKTQWGTVDAIGFVGERYYWMIDKHGCVSMLPASVVESLIEQDN